MNAVEKILRQGLQDDPADMSVRLELAEKLAAREGAGEELSSLIESAPVAPDSAVEMHRFLELAAEHEVDNEIVNGLVEKFVAAHPADGWGHHVYALGLSRSGDDERALKHYEAAKKLNPDTHDAALESALEDKNVEAPHQCTAAVALRAEDEPELTAEQLEEVLHDVDEVTEAEEDVVAVQPAKSLAPPGQERVEVAAHAPVAEAAEEHGHEHGHEHDHEHHLFNERSLVVGEGEMFHAHEKEPDTGERVSAIAVAVGVHVALIVFFAWFVIAVPMQAPPQIVGTQIANLEDTAIETVEIEKKTRQLPTDSATARVEVMTVTGASSVAIPEITVDVDSFAPIGVGDSLGLSMSFDAGEDGGMVSFFGARSVSKKVVFVVDFSASMRGDKDKLMRKELKKSVESLPNGVEYQLILFSGPAWYAGQKHVKKGDKRDDFYNDYVVDGSKKFKWYGGWDEKSRIKTGGKTSILFHFADGDDDKLPKGTYIKASRSNIRKSLGHIDETPLTVGTDWRSPLKMAMNMEPDTIYFMTDGAFGTGKGVSKEEMIDDLLSYNRKKSRAKINTICMMVLQARDELEQLADGSRGEFSLVQSDGTVVRGKDLGKKPPMKPKGKGKGKGK